MKDRFISRRYWEEAATPMGKVDQQAKQYDDVIDLGLGDPDLTTDLRIIAPTFEDVKAGHTKYTEFRGDPELRDEIQRFYQEDLGLEIKDEEIFVTAGGCIAMYLALEAILNNGEEVLVQAPYFTPYKQQIELAGGVPVMLETFEEDEFQIKSARVEDLITPRTRAIIINTPSNPTGACLNANSLETLAAIAKQHGLIVIADDIYGAYSYAEPFVPMLSIKGMRERTITINSFSKNFTMTGWRIGNIIAPPQLVKVIQQINENLMFTAPSISQRAAIYALRQRKEVQPPMIAEYKRRTFYSASRINKIPNMSVLPPKATFYLFVNIQKTGLTSEQVSGAILEEAHIVTIPGNSFGACGEGFIRIACTVSMETLKETFDRLEQVSIFQT